MQVAIDSPSGDLTWTKTWRFIWIPIPTINISIRKEGHRGVRRGQLYYRVMIRRKSREIDHDME